MGMLRQYLGVVLSLYICGKSLIENDCILCGALFPGALLAGTPGLALLFNLLSEDSQDFLSLSLVLNFH